MGKSEYRVRTGRGCQLLGRVLHHSRHRRSTKLAEWLDIVGQRYRTMTFARVVPLLVGLLYCMYQERYW